MAFIFLKRTITFVVVLCGSLGYAKDKRIIIKGRVGSGEGGIGNVSYQVLVYRKNDERICSGTILNRNSIITAAHCVECIRADQIILYAGSNRPSILGRPAETTEQVRTANYLLVHKHYDPDRDFNDIAVIKLKERLVYSDHVQKIKLPKSGENFEGTAIVSGWGVRKYGGETTSDVLMYVVVPIVPHKKCKNIYGHGLISTQICAGRRSRDSCQGDSGGPLVCKRSNGEQVLCGIVSSGKGCGRRSYPGVYTKISSFIDWIRRKCVSS